MSKPAQPTYLQSLLSTLLLLALALVTFPLSLSISIVIRLAHAVTTPSQRPQKNETILVTGARTTKSLVLARIFWKAGYRVILADEAEWGYLASARFSRCIDSCHDLPDPLVDHAAYERAIRSIIKNEKVDLWVPGSSAGATVNDAKVAEVVRAEDGINCFIQSPKEIEQLHNKDLFGDLCQKLRFTVPESILVNDADEAMAFLYADEREGREYILKCTALDDQGRSDMTKLPLTSQAKTRAHFNKMPRPISRSSPYVLQQYIEGYEFCTHCHAVDGVMQSFLSCPSSDMLMRYVDCETQFSATIAAKAEDWTRSFLETWKKQLVADNNASFNLTGHFSFDFIVDKDGTLYPIECNPRIHTAIVLLSSLPAEKLAQSYFGRMKNGLLTPPRAARERYSWLFHAIPLALAGALLPRTAQQAIHPLLATSDYEDPFASKVPAITISPPANTNLSDVLTAYITGSEKDPMLDWEDPLPFAAQHLTWIWLLGRLVFVQGKGWSRVNVSTSRIFSVSYA